MGETRLSPATAKSSSHREGGPLLFDYREHFPFRIKIRNKIIIPFVLLALAATVLGVQEVTGVFRSKVDQLVVDNLGRSSDMVTAMIEERLRELDQLSRMLAALDLPVDGGELPPPARDLLQGTAFRLDIGKVGEDPRAGAPPAEGAGPDRSRWTEAGPDGLWLCACAPLRTDTRRSVCLREKVSGSFLVQIKVQSGLDLVLFGRDQVPLVVGEAFPDGDLLRLDDFPLAGVTSAGQATIRSRHYTYYRFPLKTPGGSPVAQAILIRPGDDLVAWEAVFRRDILVTTLWFTLIAIVGFFFIVRQITTPIHQLMEAVDRVGRGDLTTPVTVTSRDEIGRLAQAFQSMTGSLRKNRQELQEATHKIIHQEKLASLGQTVASIMHEVKNPLNSLNILLQLADEEVGPQERMASLGRMKEEIRRISLTVDQFLNLSRSPRFAVEPVSVNERVRLLLGYLESLLTAHGIQIRSELDDGLPDLLLDEGRLDQIIYNLAFNALQAMKNGGVLTVATAIVPGGRGGDRAAGGYVRITVADTGAGITPEQLGKVFDPFFTTKPSGEGTGLGLTIVKSVVEEYGGRISLTSRPGEGTTAEVLFPI